MLNNRGISLLEVVIAIFLVTIGVLAILSMQPAAWRAIGKSDYMGRGAGVLHRELELREAWIMNSCNTVTVGVQPAQTITVSGLGGLGRGDATYTVNTTITAFGSSGNQWTVTVTVTWPDQIKRGYRNLSESMIVTRQLRFQQGC